jgi:major vault protein
LIDNSQSFSTPLTQKLAVSLREREVRVGPLLFSLYPGEELDKGDQDEYVLKDDEALLLYAYKEVPHPIEPQNVVTPGTEILIRGPRRYVPHRDIRVVEKRVSISLSEAEGVYVQNDDTGEVRLVKGPTDLFIEDYESMWDKYLTHEELQALGYETQFEDKPHNESRVLAAVPRKRDSDYKAVVVELEDNEAIYLYAGDNVRVEFVPKRVFWEPDERPKVLFISGGVPVKPNVLRIAKLSLGPDFIRDRLVVRTNDNATLSVDVTFRWRFIVDQANPEKIFTLKDFIGYVAQALSSEIREEAAGYNFEDFHSKAASIVKRAIFADRDTRLFEDNNLEVFGVDVEQIVPEDNEIKQKLSDAIKTNVDIYTRRAQEQAQLESERRLIEKKLIELQVANREQEVLAESETNRQAKVMEARGVAESFGITSEVERKAEEARLQAVSTILGTRGGQAYIELERAKALQSAETIIVPTDSRVKLNIESNNSR